MTQSINSTGQPTGGQAKRASAFLLPTPHSPLPTRATRAFTLIELLLVLVILAVLAALVVPKFTNRSKQARETAAKTDISTISSAINRFEIDVGRFPAGDQGLKELLAANGVNGWQGPYLERGIPKDQWGNELVYKQPGQHNPSGFDLYSLGNDGRDGTEDDIGNWDK